MNSDLNNVLKRNRLDGIRILVVDDSDDLREILEFVLKAKGALVESARDGAEAISKAQACLYDLILMDMRMPGLDGWDTAKAIKGRSEKTKIVALTGDINTSRAGSEGAPFDAVISKPIDPAMLSNSIIATIEKQG